jgi:hypothetical protein
MRFYLVLLAGITGAVATAVGCGGGNDSTSSIGPYTPDAGSKYSGDATAFTFGDDAALSGDTSSSGRSDAHGIFVISPSALQTITLTAGTQTGAVTYSATLNGVAVSAGWSIDRGDLGSITPGPSAMGTFTPSGTTGGIVTITAGFDGQMATAQVLIKLTAQQNGPTAGNAAEQAQIPTTVAQLTSGGGVGGVGGEGIGVAVSDPGTLTALQTPAGDAGGQGLSFLYPYDKTVWPRGTLAPLLMWNFAGGDADAIQISLSTTSGSFSWTGTFAKPAILQTDAGTSGPFIRHPIPQDIWDMATNTAGGTVNGQPDQLTVALTVAKGGVGYGPITETWPVAPGRLPGIIYYNSYGTQLAKNNGPGVGAAVGGDGKFGGAVLSIHVGDTAPNLVAGTTTTDTTGCRVCHSVAAGGSMLVVQHGDSYGTSSAYALAPTGATEHVLGTGATFPAMYPDGTIALSPGGQILTLPAETNLPTVTGISSVSTSLGTPAFSPDGKQAVLSPGAGPGVTSSEQELIVMAFDGTSTFSSPTVVADDTGQPSAVRPGWPAFFPDGKSLVFHHQSKAGGDGEDVSLFTRKGALAQIAWTNVTDATHVTPLDNLNGKGYLPKLAQAMNINCTGDGMSVGGINADHGDDVDLNYEPTVNPRPSGGYVWVVFTSRRMYGNEATIPPFCSDPRGVDLIKNITTKKLWVAAVDLSAAPGTDASHPAFYLPAQELLAGNSRAFWVLDPCRADGQSCQSGDQCCNGFCEASDDGGALICKNAPPNNTCSNLNDKCVTAADCCDSTNLCINGFCTQEGPPPPPK